ncbi:Disks large-associated protein 5 [Anthophora retusa]
MSSFSQQYKMKTIGFGDTNKDRFIRTEKREETRKTQRAAMFNKNRFMSNPAENTPQKKGVQLVSVAKDRMTRLLKWKVEREKRKKLEEAKKKPPFVVGVVCHKLYSPIGNDEIVDSIMPREKAWNLTASLASSKKRITRATEKRLVEKALTEKVRRGSLKNPSVTSKEEKCQKIDENCFAPDDYKFKAPVGLLQVPLFCTENTQSVSPVKIDKLIKPIINMENNDEKNGTDYAENSCSIEIALCNEEEFNSFNNDSNKDQIKSDDNIIHNSKENSNGEQNKGTHNGDKEVTSSPNSNVLLQSDSPNKLLSFSPYIVSSRGKKNARKEQQLKRGFSFNHSSNDDVPTKDTIMKSLNISVEKEERTAQYFQFLLNREITRLLELCKKWTEIKAEPETTEDGQYEINQAIRQTNLLIDKKFERFRGLVADCETGKGEMLVTCKDLQGFWDMVYTDVKKCDSQFERLEELRSQGWKREELSFDKSINKKRSILKYNVASTKTSSIRASLAEKKQKMAQEIRNDSNTKEIEVTSNRILSNKYEKSGSSNVKYKTRKSMSMSSIANEKDYAPNKRDKRLSLLQKVHLSETVNRIKSPLTMRKVSQMCRTPEVHLDDTISYINSDQTPRKSILKSSKSANVAVSRVKSTNKVNFDDRIILNEVPIYEETQAKIVLAAALSRIDSFNFDNPDEVTIQTERKLVFGDNSFYEPEENIEHFESKNSTIKNINKMPIAQVQPVTPLLNTELNENFSTPSPRRSLRRQNAFDESDEILHKTSPLKEFADDANLNTLKEKLQKHVSRNDKEEISEHNESIRVLRNRTVTAVGTPIVKKRSLKEVSASIQESEHKENKTPSRRRKSSFKVNSNDEKKINLHSWIDNTPSAESSPRRSTRNIKYLKKEYSGCETEKPASPSITPHIRKSRGQSSDRKRKSVVTEDFVSRETPEKPPQRIRSQNKKGQSLI